MDGLGWIWGKNFGKIMNIEVDNYTNYKEKEISGRYITNESIGLNTRSFLFNVLHCNPGKVF